MHWLRWTRWNESISSMCTTITILNSICGPPTWLCHILLCFVPSSHYLEHNILYSSSLFIVFLQHFVLYLVCLVAGSYYTKDTVVAFAHEHVRLLHPASLCTLLCAVMQVTQCLITAYCGRVCGVCCSKLFTVWWITHPSFNWEDFCSVVEQTIYFYCNGVMCTLGYCVHACCVLFYIVL